MNRLKRIAMLMLTGSGLCFGAAGTSAQEPVPAFKAGVDLVRVHTVVRDRRGRFVTNLTRDDFEVIDDGERRAITDFSHDTAGVSAALLFDVSGSMKAKLNHAREAANHVLSWLHPEQDESAVFAFDTNLEEIAPFASGLRRLPEAAHALEAFGATSVYDAIAQTAERVAAREGRRHAVVVFTDGLDNASRLSASEVSGIASSIDVPVYVVWIVTAIDNPSAEIGTPTSSGRALLGSLSDLADWTGGRLFAASAPSQRSATARQILDELRHQYLIAFEADDREGWHPLVVRVRDQEYFVRTRGGYIAGRSRPISH